jgi:hypothetical protein
MVGLIIIMQEESSNIILGLAGQSDCFTLRYGWFKFTLKIKPLSAKQLIEISREVSKLKSIDEEQEMFPALMENASDTLHIARVITIATGTHFRYIVTRAIMKLPLQDLKTLFTIVHKQSDPTPFFFITVLAKGRMNLLRPKEQ